MIQMLSLANHFKASILAPSLRSKNGKDLPSRCRHLHSGAPFPIPDLLASPQITTVFSYLLLPAKLPAKILALTTTTYLPTVLLFVPGPAGQFYTPCTSRWAFIPTAAFCWQIGWWLASTRRAFCRPGWPFYLSLQQDTGLLK